MSEFDLDWLDLPDPTEDETRVLAERLAIARLLSAKLGPAIIELSAELAARMEADDVEVPGVGVLRRSWKRRSEWANDTSGEDLRRDVRDAVVRDLALDLRTGELDTVTRNIAGAAVDAVFEILPAPSSIKQSAKRYGLRIGDYRRFSDSASVAVEVM